MRVAVGADHAGVALKDHLVEKLRADGHQVEDLGTHGTESVDYPDFAEAVAGAVAQGDAERGVVVCGTGLGMSITANKVPGVRAVTCSDAYSCAMARRHNDANVLALGSRVIGRGVAEQLVDVFLSTDFEGGRHARRVEKINRLDG